MGTRNRLIRSFLLVIFCALIAYSVHDLTAMPLRQRIAVGQELQLNLDIPEQILNQFSVYVQSNEGEALRLKNSSARLDVFGLGKECPVATVPGTANLQIRLFGVIPIRSMVVDVVPAYKVFPGGQSIGVVMQSKGILVVGYSPIETEAGPLLPAEEAGIRVGDIILSAGGRPVGMEDAIAKTIDAAGKKGNTVVVKVRRHDRVFEYRVRPVYCKETQRYRIGLYVRDNAAGVGTLTFIDSQSNLYGALGHIVSNGSSDQEIELRDGRIIESVVQGIQQGKRGQPGEKIGMFVNEGGLSGTIEKNTKCGIFGSLTTFPGDLYTREPMPVALAGEIKEGPATVLTVVSGRKVEAFQIEITKIMSSQQATGKGLILKIVDKRLIDLTGGIVQGMSGSPILQDGKLVGAVTHVFVNDPTQGYGVLAEWMLIESGVLGRGQTKEAGEFGVEFPGFLASFAVRNHIATNTAVLKDYISNVSNETG